MSSIQTLTFAEMESVHGGASIAGEAIMYGIAGAAATGAAPFIAGTAAGLGAAAGLAAAGAALTAGALWLGSVAAGNGGSSAPQKTPTGGELAEF